MQDGAQRLRADTLEQGSANFSTCSAMFASNNILNIKLNYDTANKNISRSPGIVLFPYSPESSINIKKYIVFIFATWAYKL